MRSLLLRSLMFLACLWIGCGLAWAAPEAASSRLPRDTTFVIDTSASMDGLPIEKARQALLLALERLQPSDWFNVIELNSKAKALFSGSVPAQAASVRHALSYARNLRTGSGTNSLPPFQAGCNDGEASSGLVRQVVLITDGAVVDEKAALRLLKGDLGDCRLFVVGVGALADTDFLRRVAVLGRGPFTHIAESAEVASKMVVLFEQLESPLPYRFEVPRDKASGSTSYFGPGSEAEAAWAIDGEVITDTAVIRLPCARVFDPRESLVPPLQGRGTGGDGETQGSRGGVRTGPGSGSD